MKIYVVTTGDNEITVSLNGEAAVTKTVKPTITATASRNFRFECDGIDEEVESYLDIFINGQPLKGSWLSDEEWLSVALFDAIMNKTFVSSGSPGGGSSYLVYTALFTQAGTSNPVAEALQDDFGTEDSWERFGAGTYETGTNVPTVGSKVYVQGLIFDEDGNSNLIPIYTTGGVLGMLLGIYFYDDGGTLVVGFVTKNAENTPTDLGELITALGVDPEAKFALPKIEVYQNG